MLMRQKSDLHEYQQKAIDWIFEHDRSLALMPVGAGKTVVTMTALQELMAEGVIKRPLVFAPMRVAENVWPYEGREWAHLQDLPIVRWGGAPENWPESIWRRSREVWGQRSSAEARLPKIVDTIKRRVLDEKLQRLLVEEKQVNKEARKAVAPLAVHVTSFENLPWLTELYAPGESPFDAWVFDEVGRLKNPKSPRYKAARKHTVGVPIVIGLNATPAPEGFFDLYAQVSIIDNGKLWGKSYYAWRQKYFTPADYLGYVWRLQLGAAELLLKDLNTLAFKVDETQLAYQRSMAHSQIVVDLPPKARVAYDAMAKKMALEIEGKDDIVAMSMASASMKLRQIANGFVYSEDGETHILHEEKAHALAELIDDMGREPLIISYEFIEDLEAIRRVWKNVPYLGQGIGANAARETIERWNRRELPVLALHRMSAGHGLNLQAGGSHVAWYSLPWDLEGYLQLNGRVDRQGQTRACFGHHLVARYTIDQRVSDVLTAKDVSQQKIINAIRSL
jgi:hypothetical protein